MVVIINVFVNTFLYIFRKRFIIVLSIKNGINICHLLAPVNYFEYINAILYVHDFGGGYRVNFIGGHDMH